MKNSVLCIFWLILVLLLQPTYSQENSNVSETDKLKNEAVALFKQRNFEESKKIMLQVIQIKEKQLGSQHIEVAKELFNLGVIEVSNEELKEGEKTINKAVSIYQSAKELNAQENIFLANMFDILGYIKFRRNEIKDAVQLYSQSLDLKVKFSGDKTLETERTLWALANCYISLGNYQTAKAYYEKVLEIRSNNLDKFDSDEIYNVMERYECAANKSGFSGFSAQVIENTKAKLKNTLKPRTHGGVVNGKAIKLVRPTYPVNTGQGKSGSVTVKIVIDENGRVIFACAESGFSGFYRVAEDAAIKSQFSPTLVNGIPSKVTGVIVYQFNAR